MNITVEDTDEVVYEIVGNYNTGHENIFGGPDEVIKYLVRMCNFRTAAMQRAVDDFEANGYTSQEVPLPIEVTKVVTKSSVERTVIE